MALTDKQKGVRKNALIGLGISVGPFVLVVFEAIQFSLNDSLKNRLLILAVSLMLVLFCLIV